MGVEDRQTTPITFLAYTSTTYRGKKKITSALDQVASEKKKVN